MMKSATWSISNEPTKMGSSSDTPVSVNGRAMTVAIVQGLSRALRTMTSAPGRFSCATAASPPSAFSPSECSCPEFSPVYSQTPSVQLSRLNTTLNSVT